MVLTQRVGTEMQKVVSMICFHTTMVLTQQTQWKLTCSSAVKCFHTTMVLTQLWTNGRHIGLRRNVSIPLWFLRNQSYREH